MPRGYSTATVSRGFQITLPGRIYQTSTISIEEIESDECKLIQQKKDELLISLTKYFAKQIEKESLTKTLGDIKKSLMENCPTYTSRVGCC